MGPPGPVARVPGGREATWSVGTSARSRCAVRSPTCVGGVVAERVREFGGADRLPVIRRELGRGVVGGRRASSFCRPVCGVHRRDESRPWPGALPECLSRRFRPGRGHSAGSPVSPVVIENDCNLAVIAERWCGAARDLDDVVCVLAGERIGAVRSAGTLMRGHEGAAGQLAFLGAFEVEHGARGIAQLVRELSGEAPEAVFTAAGAGDEEALAIVERAERWAGPRDRDDGTAREPGGRRDRGRRGAGGGGAAGAAARAAGGRWCGTRRGWRHRRWPSAVRCSARSGSRSYELEPRAAEPDWRKRSSAGSRPRGRRAGPR